MRRHSPYNYAFNNPLRYIDPDGMEPYEVQVAVKMDGYVADDGNGNYNGGSGGRNIKQQTANCTICNKIIASVQKLISSFMSNPSNEEEAIQQQDTRDRVERVSNTVEDLRDAQRSVIDVIPGGGTLNAMVDANVGSGSGSDIAVAAGLDITLGLIPGGKAAKGGGALVETVSGILKPGGSLIGKAGSNSSIRELSGGIGAAQNYWGRLVTSGASPVLGSSYKGTLMQLPNGGTIGFRTMMSRSPGTAASIDVNISGFFQGKLKFNP